MALPPISPCDFAAAAAAAGAVKDAGVDCDSGGKGVYYLVHGMHRAFEAASLNLWVFRGASAMAKDELDVALANFSFTPAPACA